MFVFECQKVVEKSTDTWKILSTATKCSHLCLLDSAHSVMRLFDDMMICYLAPGWTVRLKVCFFFMCSNEEQRLVKVAVKKNHWNSLMWLTNSKTPSAEMYQMKLFTCSFLWISESEAAAHEEQLFFYCRCKSMWWETRLISGSETNLTAS